jgi:hypothetical protein
MQGTQLSPESLCKDAPLPCGTGELRAGTTKVYPKTFKKLKEIGKLKGEE